MSTNVRQEAASDYLIHSDLEMARLERQAAVYGTQDDLDVLELSGDEQVLDAGCGAGTLTRTIARAVPRGRVLGIDRDARYIAYALNRARADGLENADFVHGDAAGLPFEDDRFDVVWSKHLLQWMANPLAAIKESVRVTRPGGRVIAANFDGFLVQHFPEDPQVQRDNERWFEAARARMGFDNCIGRKLPVMFSQAGLTDVGARIVCDRAYSGFGGDPERLWNMRVQMDAVEGFSAEVFGSVEAARAYRDRFLRRFDDPGVYWHCALFYVEGRKAS